MSVAWRLAIPGARQAFTGCGQALKLFVPLGGSASFSGPPLFQASGLVLVAQAAYGQQVLGAAGSGSILARSRLTWTSRVLVSPT